MKVKIYAVYHRDTVRLIEASNRLQALAYVSNGIIDAHMAEQAELVTLLGKGVKIEKIKDADQLEINYE